MKKKLLVISLAAILAAPTAFASYDGSTDLNTGTADDAADKQNVKIIVPEVALLQVADADVNITMPAPVNAGEGFKVTSNQTSSAQLLKISSNSEAGVTTGDRKLTASIATELPSHWKLTVAPSTTVGTLNTLAFTDSLKSIDIITAILNKRDASGTITYTFGPETDGDMMAFSAADDAAKTIEITYTLSDV